jgi:hypothetical protein
MIGSKNGLFGLSRNYSVIPYSPMYNGRDYSVIFDYDPISKLLNALPGDIIKCKICRAEGFSVYDEWYFRRVVSTDNDVGVISPSGICEGNKITAGDRIRAEEQEAEQAKTEEPTKQVKPKSRSKK